jgi:diguanylate cyclase (GGDEF)-like protein
MTTMTNSAQSISPGEMIEFPGAPLSPDSRFYIERPPLEARAYAEINKPGGLVRLKAARKMGKSSLMLRIAQQASVLGYHIVTVDFNQADSAIFSSLEKFLRWFCFNIACQLELEPRLDDFWDEEIGSNFSCSIYMKGYLLAQINTPLVLVINEANRVFEHPHIAQDFLPLLRYWHEQARINQIWQKLRLVIVHSTEVYVTLNLNQSPFNVGLHLKLSEFTPAQVQSLAQLYELKDTALVERLMQMVAGHPYLIHLALYYLHCQELTLDKLLQDAPNIGGIYTNHLQKQLATLRQQPELAAAFKQVVTAQDSLGLDYLFAYQLESLGLIKMVGNSSTVSCELYRLYFREQNLDKENLSMFSRLKQLEEENQKLQALANLDPIAQIPNRQQFELCLDTECKRMAQEKSPLSIIAAQINYFKLYRDTYGDKITDDCLRKVAQEISQTIKSPANLVARYNDQEFVILLPQIDVTGAMQIAEDIQASIKALAIPFKPPTIGGLPSPIVAMTLGVASMIPEGEKDAATILEAAKAALYQGKRDDCPIYLMK